MKDLIIYYTSDVHGFFYPTAYGERAEKDMGLFRCANQFVKDGNTLIIDGGDILQGSAFTSYCRKELDSCCTIAEIMNQCGYDYITVGNHDFNYGWDYLKEYLDHLNARCVCQNIRDDKNRAVFPYHIRIMKNGLRVAIIGIVTDYINVWEKKENLGGMRITDPLVEAAAALEEVKDKVDLTLCVYHGGFEREPDTGRRLSDTGENIAYRICEELEFDILLTGHQHMSLEGQKVCGTYVVQSQDKAQEYQFLKVSIQQGSKEICASRRKAAGICEPGVYHAFLDIEKNVQKWLDEEVGQLQEPLRPESKIRMAANGNKIAMLWNDIQLYYSKAHISAVSLPNEIYGYHSVVTRRDIISGYPYANTLVICEISGKALRAAVERSAEYFYYDVQKGLQISRDFLEPKTEHYNYDYYAGITYTIHPKAACGHRVHNLRYQGRKIKEDDKFSICINNYRATGAGNYPMYLECRVLGELNIDMAELILDYFEVHSGRIIKVKEPDRICYID